MMDSKTHAQIKKLLIIGLIASVVTVIGGELPIGWVEYPAVEGDAFGMLGMLIGSGHLSLLQLACGVLFGGVGIPLQYYGFEAAAQLAAQGGSRRSAKIIHWGALATGFLGGIVHVICVALMFVCRLVCTTEMTAIPQAALDFAIWLVAPISVVFMPIYYAMCIGMFVVILKGKTCLPKWAAVFNPLAATLVVNALPMLLPGSALVNALGMANMGIGSVWMFAGFLLLLRKQK